MNSQFRVLTAVLWAVFGLSAAKAADALKGAVVQLPPFIVWESAGEKPWLYVSTDDFEVISNCNKRLTESFVEQIARKVKMLDEFIPKGLQTRSPVRSIIILVDESFEKTMAREMVKDLESGSRPDGGNSRLLQMPQMTLFDGDVSAMICVIDSDIVTYGNLGLTPEYVLNALRFRKPALPLWYAYGSYSLFGRINWNAASSVTLPPMVWTAKARELMPLRDFFACSPEPGTDRAAMWLLESELFIHWAFDGPQARRESLWRFIDLSSKEPLTESLFAQCFGKGYDEMNSELALYRKKAMSSAATIVRSGSVYGFARSRPATPEEVFRVKGEWGRLETAYVRSVYPDLADRYVATTSSMLDRAYENGVRSPEFAAVSGLYRFENGDFLAARPLLEAAAAAEISRPSVYRALAEIARRQAGTRLGGSEITLVQP
ncbi:MAG TPA: hypothetical protein VHC46_04145 [Thermodesulfobacteriota bacterium]|nr:hypothetical protein [Candidatus Paceibacterota bacterium]HVY54929.1 hypothetical protein [Thermodesulfobacteriota bacterium]